MKNKSAEEMNPLELEIKYLKKYIQAMENHYGESAGDYRNLMMHANNIESFFTTLQQSNAELEKQNAELGKQLNQLVEDVIWHFGEPSVTTYKSKQDFVKSLIQSHESNKQP